MKIGIPAEIRAGETRVAATPDTVKKLVAMKHDVLVQSNAGRAAGQPDDAYAAAGAHVVDAPTVLEHSEVLLKVRAPSEQECAAIKRGTVLVGMLEPYNDDGIETMNAAGITAFALEAAPRTTRAQSMDVLSSQANIAGYKAVLLAAGVYGRMMPMMMTAAGTVKAARVLILGAGVAGLQAIATARRLGAVVEASDVRPAVKEQIESLGAKFVDVPFETDEERDAGRGSGGYAKPMPASWMQRQSVAVAERAKQADIVITTALIPGRKAPLLVTEAMVRSMRPGSVVLDMAVEQGGNCELSELGRLVVKHGVHIVGIPNLAATVAGDASALYARNVLDFLKLILDQDGRLVVDRNDDIVAACLLCTNGERVRKNA